MSIELYKIRHAFTRRCLISKRIFAVQLMVVKHFIGLNNEIPTKKYDEQSYLRCFVISNIIGIISLSGKGVWNVFKFYINCHKRRKLKQSMFIKFCIEIHYCFRASWTTTKNWTNWQNGLWWIDLNLWIILCCHYHTSLYSL